MKKAISISLLIIIFTITNIPKTKANVKTIFLGLAEVNNTEISDTLSHTNKSISSVDKHALSTSLRLCFKYSKGNWEITEDNINKPLKYYLLFDMKKISEISIDQKSLYEIYGTRNTPYLRGLYNIKDKISPIGKKNTKWASTWTGIKKYRPIVASKINSTQAAKKEATSMSA